MKSKIEEKIEKAREATNEMFAAFDEMNEMLESRGDMKFATLNADTVNSYFGVQKPEVIKSKFKLGDYVITKSGISGRVKQVIFGNGYFYYSLQDASVSGWKNWYLESEIGKHEIVEVEKWMPKRGEYATTIGSAGERLIVIFKEWRDKALFLHYAGLNARKELMTGVPFGFLPDDVIRPATPEEIALLDSKLAEQGKRFDKEKCELVDIPKHKEPIIGEMAIFWDVDNKKAFCATLNSLIDGRYSPDGNIRFDKAILFESPEQYKAFIKEK